MAEPERRPMRLRLQVSCALCRRRKVRCNRETPCSNCIRSRNVHGCVYQVHHPPAPQPKPPQVPRPLAAVAAACDTPKDQAPSHVQQRSPVVRSVPGSDPFITVPPFPTPPASGTSTSTTVVSGHSKASSRLDASSSAHSPVSANQATTLASGSDPDVLRRRIKELEEELSKVKLTRPSNPEVSTSPTSALESSLAGTFITHRDGQRSGHPTASASRTVNVFHKSRLFGQSHWLNGVVLLLDIFETFEPMVRNGAASKSLAGVEKCKILARTIKAQRTPPWPTIPARDLPPRDIADQLADCYLRTFGSLYRVLHIPSFKRDYQAIWGSDQQPQRVDMATVIQVKLVLAIGATVQDQDFSLRPSAIRWVFEALTFTSEPEFKSRLNIKSLQTDILLLLARETTGLGGNLTWISAGSLLRTAVYMGLHRDPVHLPRMTLFAAEMRRRLWNTVLELTVSCSMNAGAPPQISLDDYDTEPPGNFHDEQLVDTTADDRSDPSSVMTQPESEFTQTSVAIAMRKILPVRLAVAKYLNDLGSTRRQGDIASAYHESLRLDMDLRAGYRILTRTLQVLSRSLNEACWPESSSAALLFSSQFIDLVINRELAAIHIPFYSAALHEPAYAYSRKVIIESCFKIWRAVNPWPTSPSSSDVTRQDGNPQRAVNQDITRLASHGAGFCRNAGIQVSMLLLAELRAQLREEAETSFSRANRSLLRPDLLAMVTEAKEWTLRSINAGETNVKGYLFASMVSAQIDGMMKGLEGDEALARALVEAAEEVVDRCVPLLEEMLEREAKARMARIEETGGVSGQRQGRVWEKGEATVGNVSQQELEMDGSTAMLETDSSFGMMSDNNWDMLMLDAQHMGDFGTIAEPMNWTFNGATSFSASGPSIF